MAGLNLGKPVTPPVDTVDESKLAGQNPTEEPASTAAQDESSPGEDLVVYSSHPIERFAVGNDYKFQRSQLKLTKAEAEVFDELLEKCDPRTQGLVKKLDVDAANALIANHKPVATKSIDSGINPENQAQTIVGSKPIDG